MNELALFAGAGGGILGGKLLGWTTVCAVEIEPYAAGVLVQRQNDGFLDPFPIWDNVLTFDGRPWRGIVDVVSGGFPCQDISAAGRGAGIEGERSGLWSEMARIISEVRPPFAFVENSPMLVISGLDRVLGDLAEMGYDSRYGIFSAADVGAQHERERCWVLAHRHEIRLPQPSRFRAEQHAHFLGQDLWGWNGARWNFVGDTRSGTGDDSQSVLLRKSHDMANHVDRIAAIGNGQVPAVAALAWHVLSGNA